MEYWKEVKGYEGVYEVSNQGRIRSLDRHITSYLSNIGVYRTTKKKGVVLKPSPNGHGYLVVVLQSNNIKKSTRVHKVVALNFIENPNGKPCVNHIDGDKRNNNFLNLEWCTYSENLKHAHENGLRNSVRKFNLKKGLEIKEEYRKGKKTMIELAKINKVSETTIFRIIHNTIKYK